MNNNYFAKPTDEFVLSHHGILGQKWGIRRYQNPDGSLTEKGRARYGTVENLRKIQSAKADAKAYKIRAKAEAKATKKINKAVLKAQKKQNEEQKKYEKEKRDEREEYNKKNRKKEFIKEVANDVVLPAAKYAARNALGNIMDGKLKDLMTDDATKLYNRTVKDLERANKISFLQRQNIENRQAIRRVENDFTNDKDYLKIKKASEMSKMQKTKMQNDVYARENKYKLSDAYGKTIETTQKINAANDQIRARAALNYNYNLTNNGNWQNLSSKELNDYASKFKTAYGTGQTPSIKTNSSYDKNTREQNNNRWRNNRKNKR